MTESVYVPDALHQLVSRLAAEEERTPTQYMVDLVREAVVRHPRSPCTTVLEALKGGPLDGDQLHDRTPLSVSDVFLALQVLTAGHGTRRPLVVTAVSIEKPGRLTYRLA